MLDIIFDQLLTFINELFRSKKRCQSCGMPLRNEKPGTNSDGTKSKDYCNRCFQNGAFIEPDITLEEIGQKTRQRMQLNLNPNFLIEPLIADLPKLKRWQKK